MHSAKLSMIPHLVHAYLNSSDLRLSADQNVSVIANARVNWHVSIKNAETHALDLVDLMLIATLLVIHPCASVQLVKLEIRLHNVYHNVRIVPKKIDPELPQ